MVKERKQQILLNQKLDVLIVNPQDQDQILMTVQGQHIVLINKLKLLSQVPQKVIDLIQEELKKLHGIKYNQEIQYKFQQVKEVVLLLDMWLYIQEITKLLRLKEEVMEQQNLHQKNQDLNMYLNGLMINWKGIE